MTKQFGLQSEQIIIDYLKQENFKILAHNYQQFYGEIDIIASKDDVIVFVEVKARNNSMVSLHSLIPRSKQQKIIKTAKQFISTHAKITTNKTYRFDVALLHNKNNPTPELTYIPNAFQI